MSTASTAAEPAWVGDVIRFWLEETPAEARFRKDPAFDAEIAARFGTLVDELSANPPDPSRLTPRVALATVIALDQFPRNMFRGSARAFAADPIALRTARAAVEAGYDQGLDKDARLFLYLPFEHSETMADQHRSVALISALGDPELERYAVAHLDIVQRFGRFPHRNAALGRNSTPEEIAFLKEPGSSF